LLSLSAIYAHPIEARVVEEFKKDQERKHSQKINRTNSIAITQDILVGVMIKRLFRKALEAFDNIVFKTLEIIRPGRNNPRRHQGKKRYSMNYKLL
jgi:hypothetical protein